MRFDVKPVSGKWVQPTENKVDFWEATAGPDSDIEVEISPIADKDTGDTWDFTLSDSDQPIELSAEDMRSNEK